MWSEQIETGGCGNTQKQLELEPSGGIKLYLNLIYSSWLMENLDSVQTFVTRN